jgi:hypothetical protein
VPEAFRLNGSKGGLPGSAGVAFAALGGPGKRNVSPQVFRRQALASLRFPTPWHTPPRRGNAAPPRGHHDIAR